jgi:hypothetical protein
LGPGQRLHVLGDESDGALAQLHGSSLIREFEDVQGIAKVKIVGQFFGALLDQTLHSVLAGDPEQAVEGKKFWQIKCLWIDSQNFYPDVTPHTIKCQQWDAK